MCTSCTNKDIYIYIYIYIYIVHDINPGMIEVRVHAVNGRVFARSNKYTF